jgi:hypothetical protein
MQVILEGLQYSGVLPYLNMTRLVLFGDGIWESLPHAVGFHLPKRLSSQGFPLPGSPSGTRFGNSGAYYDV